MQFADGRGAERRLKDILANANRVRAAVAYWGPGAVRRLGLNKLKAKDVRLYCDVRSGSCDITEIQLLITLFGADAVRTCDTLHAKLWVTDVAAMLGSSNASTNGYGVEGLDASKLLEANVLVDGDGREEREVRRKLAQWIEDDVEPASRKIRVSDLITGDKNRPPSTGPVTHDHTVLDQIAENPNAYKGRNVFVLVWPSEDMSSKEKKELAEQGQSRGITKVNGWTGVSRAEIATLQPGSMVIEFDSAGKKPKFDSVYRVLTESPVCRIDGKVSLLCTDVRSVFGASIAKTSQKDEIGIWLEAAKRASSDARGRASLISLHDFASRYFSHQD